MKDRIDITFDALKRSNRVGFVPFSVFGHPNKVVSKDIFLDLAEADLVEFGFPFSDPTADGPVIQQAAVDAIRNGINMDDALDTMGEIRSKTSAPFIFFSYFNPIHKYGTERFVKRAAEVGFDGLLIVDLPLEETHHLKPLSDKEGLAWIYLITPTTTKDRIKRMDEAGTGFLYYVSVTGVTGVRQDLPTDLTDRCNEIRDACSLPLVVGFGISGAVQASQLKKHVDGVVAGSSIVKMISEENYGLKLKSFVQEMKEALS